MPDSLSTSRHSHESGNPSSAFGGANAQAGKPAPLAARARLSIVRHRLLAFHLLLVASISQAAHAAEWEKVLAPAPLAWPRDHGAHPRFRNEWWYVTGNLADEAGKPFGFQATFFRIGIDRSDRTDPTPPQSNLRARHIIVGHLALAHIAKGEFRFAQRARRDGGGLAGFAESDLRVWVDDWEMERGGNDGLRIHASDPAQDFGLELSLAPHKPLVLQGDRGLSVKGPDSGNASMYVSWTRLETSGTVTLDGRPRFVHGRSWFDHEWGTSQLGEGVIGWNWFALRLDDGRDLMLYDLRKKDGGRAEQSAGTLVDASGAARRLLRSEFSIESVSTWHSPATGADYPGKWKVKAPGAGLDLTVVPRIRNAEVDARATVGAAYWEGPVSVTGSAVGEGYVELTGYAGSLENQFR